MIKLVTQLLLSLSVRNRTLAGFSREISFATVVKFFNVIGLYICIHKKLKA